MRAPILAIGDPVLRTPAARVDPETIEGSEIQELIAMLRHTMHEVGVGLAAPQIGRSLQVFVMADTHEFTEATSEAWLDALDRHPIDPIVAINPTITPLSEEKTEAHEGCLSVAGYRASVRRWRNVRLDAIDDKGTPFSVDLTGWNARIAQHEIDHLNGMLYVDLMDPRSLTSEANYPRYFHGLMA